MRSSDDTWERRHPQLQSVSCFWMWKHGHWKPHANYHKLIHLQPFASSSSAASQAWHEQISSICSFLAFLHTATSYTLENQHGSQKFMVCRCISSYEGDIFRFQPFIFRGYYPSRGWWWHRIVSSHVHQSTFEKLLRYPIMPAPQPRANLEQIQPIGMAGLFFGWLNYLIWIPRQIWNIYD